MLRLCKWVMTCEGRIVWRGDEVFMVTMRL
jgi:hypothetical protein